MLSDNDKMEELSYAYMHALAAKGGFRCVRPVPDRDSVDVQVQSRGKLTPGKLTELLAHASRSEELKNGF